MALSCLRNPDRSRVTDDLGTAAPARGSVATVVERDRWRRRHNLAVVARNQVRPAVLLEQFRTAALAYFVEGVAGYATTTGTAAAEAQQRDRLLHYPANAAAQAEEAAKASSAEAT